MSAQLQTLSLSRLGRLRRQEFVEQHLLRLICLGLVALSLAGLLYLTQASAVTTTTYEIQELQQREQRLLRERDRLRAQIAVATQPQIVRERALALGFEPTQPGDLLPVTEAPVLAQQPSRTVPIAEQSPGTLELVLAEASEWLQDTMGLLPATRQVEAGSAEQQ